MEHGKLMKFETTFLKEELDLPYSFEDSQFVDEHRWYDERLGIFTYENVTYGVYYCDPKTEMEEDMDPFNDLKEVTAFEVEKVPVTTYEWRKK